MRLTLRVLSVALFGIALLTQYTNCGQAAPQPVEAPSVTDCTTTNTCPPSPADNLSIVGPSDRQVLSTAAAVEIAGTCSPSTYPNNAITWQIYDEYNNPQPSTIVNGLVTGACLDYLGSCGVCQNGQFYLGGAQAINFQPPAHTGWYVKIEIRGLDASKSFMYVGNPGKSIWRVNLSTP